MVTMRKLAAFLHLSKASSALFNIKQITSTSAFELFVFTCPHKSFHSFHFIRKRILFALFLYVFAGYRYRPGWNLTRPQSSLCSTRQRTRWKSRGWWEGRRVEDFLRFLPTHLTLRSLFRYPSPVWRWLGTSQGWNAKKRRWTRQFMKLVSFCHRLPKPLFSRVHAINGAFSNDSIFGTVNVFQFSVFISVFRRFCVDVGETTRPKRMRFQTKTWRVGIETRTVL